MELPYTFFFFFQFYFLTPSFRIWQHNTWTCCSRSMPACGAQVCSTQDGVLRACHLWICGSDWRVETAPALCSVGACCLLGVAAASVRRIRSRSLPEFQWRSMRLYMRRGWWAVLGIGPILVGRCLFGHIGYLDWVPDIVSGFCSKKWLVFSTG